MPENADIPTPAAPGRGSVSGCRILITDDDRMNIRILEGILRGEGYVLREAGSGEKAIEVYREFRPHLVLLDVMLPGLDGFETCRMLRREHGDDCAPVIFITALSESDDIVKGLSAGASDYLPKPFKPKEVLARVRTLVLNRMLDDNRKQLVEQLSAANAAKNKFLGMAAHDLRNPLASVRGLAEFLRDGTVGPLEPEQLDLVNTIHDASQSMLDLVNDLLDVATIEAGELKVRRERTRLGGLIERCVRLRTMDATRKNMRIELRRDGADPAGLYDPARMAQVADNLLSNAVKYSPPGSVIAVEVSSDLEKVRLSVKDQGPGIPAGERDRLFKDFSRLSALPTGGEKSTGLGLAICRKIVEAHGGSISAENLPGGGCEFSVTLPLNP